MSHVGKGEHNHNQAFGFTLSTAAVYLVVVLLCDEMRFDDVCLRSYFFLGGIVNMRYLLVNTAHTNEHKIKHCGRHKDRRVER